MVKECGLKDAYIAVRPVSRHDNDDFFVDENAPIVISNRFTAGM